MLAKRILEHALFQLHTKCNNNTSKMADVDDHLEFRTRSNVLGKLGNEEIKIKTQEM